MSDFTDGRLHSERVWFNPMDWLRNRITEEQFASVGTYISFDADVKPQFRIIRASRHDGTLLFVEQLVWEALGPLVERRCWYAPDVPADPATVASIRYTVGRARIVSVFGLVDLPCGMVPGERQRITIPVRSHVELKR